MGKGYECTFSYPAVQGAKHSSVFRMFTGSGDLSQSLRQQCAAELYVNAERYAEHNCLMEKSALVESDSSILSATLAFDMAVSTPCKIPMDDTSLEVKVRVVKNEARLVLNGGQPSLLQAAALATVIKRPIHSLCLDKVRL